MSSLVGCHRVTERATADFSATVRSVCPPRTSDEFFFPVRLLPTLQRESALLRALGEPSLSCENEPSERYRIFLSRPFQDSLVIRMDRSRSGYVIVAHSFTGGTGGEPLTLRRVVSKAITELQGRAFSAAFEQAGFWAMTTVPVRGPGEAICLDCVGATVEAKQQLRYHVVERSPALESGAFRGACEMLVSLAGL